MLLKLIQLLILFVLYNLFCHHELPFLWYYIEQISFFTIDKDFDKVFLKSRLWAILSHINIFSESITIRGRGNLNEHEYLVWCRLKLPHIPHFGQELKYNALIDVTPDFENKRNQSTKTLLRLYICSFRVYA